MATTTKKTTAARANEIETTKTIAVPEETLAQQVSTPKKQRKFLPDDVIECRSITHGELVMEGKKSKLSYSWADIGDTAYVEYQDLQALQSTRSRFLTEPLFIIEDDELVEQWSSLLKETYDKINDLDMDKFFKMSASSIKSTLKQAPNGFKKSVKSRAAAMIMNGELDSISRIKAIDEVLGTELMMMIE